VPTTIATTAAPPAKPPIRPPAARAAQSPPYYQSGTVLIAAQMTMARPPIKARFKVAQRFTTKSSFQNRLYLDSI
jgi:hypothetical protein